MAFSGESTTAVYSIGKTALLGLVKVFARDFQYDEIRVNAICPGLVDTKLASTLVKNKEIVAQMTGSDKVIHPDEIGSVAAFLCSQDAITLSGEAIMATGFLMPKF